MNILYANEECSNLEEYYTIFAAGPTARDKKTKSWRPDLILELNKYEKLSNKIMILNPESRGSWLDNYDDQIDWEQRHLENADLLVFWVPRELENMPAFTTNIEFGMYIMNKEKDLIYGRPNSSPKNKYLDFCYNKYRCNKPIETLENLALEIKVHLNNKLNG